MDLVKKRKSKGWSGPSGLSGRIHHDKATINRILLSFRPIAPKPATDGSVVDTTKTTWTDAAKGRPKRKYVRVKRNNNSSSVSGSDTSRRKCKTAGKAIQDDNRKDLRFDVDGGGVFSLETAVPRAKSSPEEIGSTMNMMMSFGLSISLNNDNLGLGFDSGLGSVERPDRAVETWVVVSGVTETTLAEVIGGGGGGLLGCTDGEKMKNLEGDTCPGLISDGLNRVQWVNLAYKRMVDPGWDDGAPPAELVVRLVVKEDIPMGFGVFACTVRVVYTWRKEKYSKTMPCDVWKMDFGGFAWRLDANAALCLGR